jgi:hypothetical protein
MITTRRGTGGTAASRRPAVKRVVGHGTPNVGIRGQSRPVASARPGYASAKRSSPAASAWRGERPQPNRGRRRVTPVHASAAASMRNNAANSHAAGLMSGRSRGGATGSVAPAAGATVPRAGASWSRSSQDRPSWPAPCRARSRVGSTAEPVRRGAPACPGRSVPRQERMPGGSTGASLLGHRGSAGQPVPRPLRQRVRRRSASGRAPRQREACDSEGRPMGHPATAELPGSRDEPGIRSIRSNGAALRPARQVRG